MGRRWGCWRERWWERQATVSSDEVQGEAGGEAADEAADEARGEAAGGSGGSAVRNHFRRRIL